MLSENYEQTLERMIAKFVLAWADNVNNIMQMKNRLIDKAGWQIQDRGILGSVADLTTPPLTVEL